MLLIWGRQDKMIPYSLSRQFLDLNPKLCLVDVDNAGHCAHDECPEQVNQILQNWIDELVLEKPPLTAKQNLSTIPQ